MFAEWLSQYPPKPAEHRGMAAGGAGRHCEAV
jgi:hypothetical protein